MFEPGASGSSELGGPVAGTTSGARTASTDGRTGGNHRPATNIPHASPNRAKARLAGGPPSGARREGVAWVRVLSGHFSLRLLHVGGPGPPNGR